MNLPISGTGAQFAYVPPPVLPKSPSGPVPGTQPSAAEPRGAKRSAPGSSVHAGARKRQQLMGTELRTTAARLAECGAGSAHLTPQLSFQLEFAGAERQLLDTMMQEKNGAGLLAALAGPGAGALSGPDRHDAIRRGLQAIGARCQGELARMDALPAVPNTTDQSLRAARLAARSASASNGMREMHERLAAMAGEALSLLAAISPPAASPANDPVAFAATFGAHEPYDAVVEEREPRGAAGEDHNVDGTLSSEQAFAATHGAIEEFGQELAQPPKPHGAADDMTLSSEQAFAAAHGALEQFGQEPVQLREQEDQPDGALQHPVTAEQVFAAAHGAPEPFDAAHAPGSGAADETPASNVIAGPAPAEAGSPEQLAQALSSLGHDASPAGTRGSGRTVRQPAPPGEPAQQRVTPRPAQQYSATPPAASWDGHGQMSHEPPPPPPYTRRPGLRNSFPLPPSQPYLQGHAQHFPPMPGPNAPWQATQRPWQAPNPGGQQPMPQQPARASGMLRIAASIGGSYLASALREAGRFLGRFGLR